MLKFLGSLATEAAVDLGMGGEHVCIYIYIYSFIYVYLDRYIYIYTFHRISISKAWRVPQLRVWARIQEPKGSKYPKV